MEKCTEHITLKCTAEFKEKIERAAEKERRSVSNLIKIVMERWIEEEERKEKE